MQVENRRKLLDGFPIVRMRYPEQVRMALKAYVLKSERPEGATYGSSFRILGQNHNQVECMHQ